MENLVFKDLNLSSEILRAIEEMGFEEATPIQSQAIPPVLEGKDVIAQAPTGTGKTCAFGIPLIEMLDTSDNAVQGLILCPTRELVIQTAAELKKVSKFKEGVRIIPIYGGQQIDRQIMALRRKPQIVVATPGRLMDHMRRHTIKLQNIKMLVLDEADEMLNMGFREDIDTILETAPAERQTVMFSATISQDIKNIAHLYQKDAITVKVTHKEITVPTIEQFYLEIKGKNKLDVLTRLIDTNDFRLCLIFCNTKRMVDELAESLDARGYAAEALHGDLKQMQRDRVMARFRSGTVDILVATDVAARGLDIDNIDAVFNYDLPNDEEYYVHRIGRTARINRKGVSYTFITGREIHKLRDIMRFTKSTMTLVQAPSMTDVEEVKVGGVLRTAKDAAKNKKLTKCIDYIERAVEEDDELTTVDLAAALLDMLLGDEVFDAEKEMPINEPQRKQFAEPGKRAMAKTEGRKSGAEPGMVRMFINVGTLDKMKKRHIIELLTEKASIDSSLIGVIDIYDKYSFLEVSFEYADKVIEALNHYKYKGRTVVIERASQRKKR